MDPKVVDYLAGHHAAAMITLRPDGSPHAVRCGIALVDGKLWSSGTRTRKRTDHLRRDPRCTLFVFGNRQQDPYSYLSLDTRVTILDGPEAADQNVRLFTEMQAGMDRPDGALFWNGKPLPIDEFRQTMIVEGRLIYQFEILHSYGMF
jgi:PPOX class probable F420-dependent enzyme